VAAADATGFGLEPFNAVVADDEQPRHLRHATRVEWRAAGDDGDDRQPGGQLLERAGCARGQLRQERIGHDR
jgi:hypothetical protein